MFMAIYGLLAGYVDNAREVYADIRSSSPFWQRFWFVTALCVAMPVAACLTAFVGWGVAQMELYPWHP